MVDYEQPIQNELNTTAAQLEKPEFEQPIHPDNMEAFLTELEKTLQDPEMVIWEKISKHRHNIDVKVNANSSFVAQREVVDITPKAYWEQHKPDGRLQLEKGFSFNSSENFEFHIREGDSHQILRITSDDFWKPTIQIIQYIDPDTKSKLIKVTKVEKFDDFLVFQQTTLYFLINS